jgi:RNA polymerase sigma-70 factor (ECF subfamily)
MLTDRLQTFEQYRAMLFSMAYRMLGTISDAEDMVQETFLRWHKASEVDVYSPKSYLATTLTRLCLDHLQSARVKREQYVGPWLPEPVITGPDLESKFADSLAVGFLLLMESLSPAERAVFLLREVFEFDYSEIAEMVMKSEQNCRQLFRRARKQISDRKPRFETSRADRDRLLNEFVRASSSGDLQGLLKILKEDVTLISDGGGKVAAALNPIYGADRVSRFILGVTPKLPAGLTISHLEVNGVPGIAFYLGSEAYTVIVPEVSENNIQSIYIISNPDKLQDLLGRPVIR